MVKKKKEKKRKEQEGFPGCGFDGFSQVCGSNRKNEEKCRDTKKTIKGRLPWFPSLGQSGINLDGTLIS